jgi:hypothetical protein
MVPKRTLTYAGQPFVFGTMHKGSADYADFGCAESADGADLRGSSRIYAEKALGKII